ncbi:MAG TPA: hypothetical protein VIX73_35105, partial [Kofleriaceae bacterium]
MRTMAIGEYIDSIADTSASERTTSARPARNSGRFASAALAIAVAAGGSASLTAISSSGIGASGERA